MNNLRPCIYEYNDFREYLKDLYEYLHVKDKKFNKAFICRSIGLPNSRSYFQDVLNGKVVSAQKVPSLIDIFNLNKDEARFFKTLVKYNQTNDDPDEKDMLFDLLMSQNKTPINILTKTEYAYYKNWYNSVIRAILNVIDFKDDYKTLSKLVMPNITVKQAKDSIRLMKNLKLIKRDAKGYLKPSKKIISTGEKIRSDIVRQYQSSCIEMARTAIIQNQTQPQRITTKTLSFSKDIYEQIEKKIEKVNKEITALVHSDKDIADHVYQLDILLFPLMKKRK